MRSNTTIIFLLFRFTSDDIERIARKAIPEKKPDSFCAETLMDGDAGFEDTATEPKQVGRNFVLTSLGKSLSLNLEHDNILLRGVGRMRSILEPYFNNRVPGFSFVIIMRIISKNNVKL